MKDIILIISIVLNLVLAMFVYAGWKDTKFLQSTAPVCDCRYDLIVCQNMNMNLSKLLKGESICSHIIDIK